MNTSVAPEGAEIIELGSKQRRAGGGAGEGAVSQPVTSDPTVAQLFAKLVYGLTLHCVHGNCTRSDTADGRDLFAFTTEASFTFFAVVRVRSGMALSVRSGIGLDALPNVPLRRAWREGPTTLALEVAPCRIESNVIPGFVIQIQGRADVLDLLLDGADRITLGLFNAYQGVEVAVKQSVSIAEDNQGRS